MYFKNPEILYFLLLLIVPILVHLFQLRRFKKEYFTNVRFLKELSIQTRKSSKIKKYLLLATRMLLLICVIIAFAQPSFKTIDKNATATELFIILDNSFSMQAKGKKGELLKRAVQELLENTPENLHFSLLTSSENFWNTDIKSIRTTLLKLDYSALPFKLDNLLSQVKARKSANKKEVVIITDAIGISQKQLQNKDETTSLNFIIPKAEQKNNIAIDSVLIKAVSDDFYDIGVTLKTYGETANAVPIALFNQNKLIAKTTLNLNSANKSVIFTIPKQLFHGYVSIVDNGLPYDNTYFFSISKPKKGKVLSVGEFEKSNFLSRIFTTDEFDYYNYSLRSLDYNKLQDQDVIVINELEEIPQALQTTLKSFVDKGGNLIMIPSALSSSANLNALLQNFGNIRFSEIDTTERLITSINFNHPLFKSVFENKVKNFQFPKTKSSFTLSSSHPALSYQDQSVFLTSVQTATSAVYVFSAPLNTENSNFQQSPLIVPTFYKMAVSNQNNSINALTIGNYNPHLTTANLNKDDILTVKGAEEQFIPIQQILNSKVKMNFTDYPKKSGNFEIYNKNQWLENISFNYNRTESDLTQNNKSIASEYKISESTSAFFDTLQTNRSDSQLWKWFVIFALLFLLTEMAIVRFVK